MTTTIPAAEPSLVQSLAAEFPRKFAVRSQPPLEAGDHLDQATFHARYEAMPLDFRAELLEGIVYMPSPMKLPHGTHQLKLSGWLDQYEVATPGTCGGSGLTVILVPESEPQPDGCLVVLPEKGGQVRITDDEYLAGAPELVAEIASSTESYDLHAKKRVYEKAGVREYLVVALRQQQVFWFTLREGRFHEQPPDADGLYRSQVFPGLWLDPAALLRLDGARLQQVSREGLASAEHAAFAAKLAAIGGLANAATETSE